MTEETRKMEEMGIEVTTVNEEGKIVYRTNLNTSSDVCDSCQHLRILPDPDPTDWFNADDQKAHCEKKARTIAGSLRPRETYNICKPLWCPFLRRELTDEEKKRLEILNKNR